MDWRKTSATYTVGGETILSLYRLWRQIEARDQARYVAWALSSQQLLPRDTFNKDVWGDCDLFLHQAVVTDEYRYQVFRDSALVVGWYRRSPWSDAELVEQLSKSIEGYSSELEPTVRELFENLGDAGRGVIADWERRRAERQAKRRERKEKKS